MAAAAARRAAALSATQQRRRAAIKDLDDASHLHLFRPRGDGSGRLTLSARGVGAVAFLSGSAYYLLRLLLRDYLGRLPWYRLLQRKADRTKLFELYLLSIVNAGVMAGFSCWKIFRCPAGDTRGVTRMLASCLGYFAHDFWAMRYEFKNDPPMLLHHVLATVGTSLVVGRPEVHRFVPMLALTEMSTVFLSLRWLLAETGQAASRKYKAVLLLFGSTFFATRVVNLNRRLRELWNDAAIQRLHPLRWMVLALSGLNLFWFTKIIKMARRQMQ